MKKKKAQKRKDAELAESEPRLSIREEQKRVTYERLLNAAKELFEVSSADEVTIDQITRRAGTNRTTFYLHFEDKADIAFKIRTRYMSSVIDSMARLVEGGRQVTRDDIRKWLKDRARFFQNHKTLIELGTDSMNRKPELMMEFLEQSREILNTGLNEYLKCFSQEEREYLEAELLLNAILFNRYMHITVVQGLKFPGKNVPDVMVEIWYELLTRNPGKSAK